MNGWTAFNVETKAAAPAPAPVPEPKKERPFKFGTVLMDDGRGRFRIQDTSAFALDSFYRKRDRGSSLPGVSLQMGRTEDTGREEVVTILFDKSRFTEEQAAGWWRGNRCRFTLSKPLD